MATLDERERLAADWIAARRLARRTVADLPPELKPAAEESAYRIQAAVLARLTAGGRGEPFGWKVGVTTPQMRALLGLDAPIAGAMLAGGRFAPGAAIRAADYCRIGIECEIAFVLAHPLGGDGAPVGAGAAAAAVASAHAAIELVDDRYGGDFAAFGVPAIVADDAFHAGFALGPPCPDWRRLDLGAVRGVTRVDGSVRLEGYGRDVQGHPLLSLAWLANRLGALGARLEAGDVVSTGSLPVVYWAQPGEHVDIEIDGLGGLGVTVT